MHSTGRFKPHDSIHYTRRGAESTLHVRSLYLRKRKEKLLSPDDPSEYFMRKSANSASAAAEYVLQHAIAQGFLRQYLDKRWPGSHVLKSRILFEFCFITCMSTMSVPGNVMVLTVW